MKMTAIENAHLVLESGIRYDGTLLIEDGKIVAFGRREDVQIPENASRIDAKGAYVGPGFIDIHVHACGTYSTKTEPEKAGKAMLRHGTTSFLATPSYGQNFEEIMESLRINREAMGKVPNLKGIYMEGPYMNPDRGAGAWRNPWRGPIDENQYKAMVDAGGDMIKVWAIAPEREGLLPFLAYARKVNPDVLFAVGHSDAAPDQIRALGAKFKPAVHTHLHNATGKLGKGGGVPFYGADNYCLNDPEVYAELISDAFGCHVHPEVQQTTLRCKGVNRVILITDGTPWRDNPAPERYAHATDLNFDERGGISGSRLTMPQACRNIMTHTNCGIAQVFLMASTNPARLLGMDHEIGSIALGKTADLVFVNDLFQVQKVILSGEICEFEEE